MALNRVAFKIEARGGAIAALEGVGVGGRDVMRMNVRWREEGTTSMTCVSSGGDDFENFQSNCMPWLVSMPPLHCCSSSTLRKRPVSLWLIL